MPVRAARRPVPLRRRPHGRWIGGLALGGASLLVLAASAGAASGDCTASAGTTTCTYTTTGAGQSFTTPAGVTSVHVFARGAAGASVPFSRRGGFGAEVTGDLAVSPGDVLTIVVGGPPVDFGPSPSVPCNSVNCGGGFNGGGHSQNGGGGGGASDIRVGAANLTDRVLVAAGGGGAGATVTGFYACGSGGQGGDAGQPGGVGDGCGVAGLAGGGAGTATAGGAGSPFLGVPGAPGSLGNGGGPTTSGFGGGGGGGLYGGGRGGNIQIIEPPFGEPGRASASASGGGGGSSLVPPGGTFAVATTGTPEITLSYATPDTTSPTVTINEAGDQDDPTSDSPIRFTVVFSEPVTGFGSLGVVLSGTADPTTAAITESGPMDGTTYTVAVSGMTGSGTVIASVKSGAVVDAAGNLSEASTSTDNTVTYSVVPPDTTSPTVTIDQASDQADPTPTSPVRFTAVFSEPVTGFGPTDVVLSGTAGATTATVTESGPMDGTTYTVSASGMTGNGTVIASVAAGAASDAAGNPSDASTSTDPTVTYTVAPALTFSVADITTAERNSQWTLKVPVCLSGVPTRAAAVKVKTASGTATSGSDFHYVDTRVAWSAGQSPCKNVSITIKGDRTREADEYFTVSLSYVYGAPIARASAKVTLRNDD